MSTANTDKLNAVFAEDAFQLPIDWDNSNDFMVWLDGIFAQYQIMLLNHYPNNKSAKHDKVKRICDHFIHAIQNYLVGAVESAYTDFKDGMAILSPYLESRYSQNDISQYLTKLYRVRLGNRHAFQPQEMFHIPFEQRQIVDSQRYSINGLPCLYVGASSYVCWEELGRPSFEDVQISRVEAKPNTGIRVLDLGFRPDYLKGHYDNAINANTMTRDFGKMLHAYVYIWPLLALCSIKTKYKNAKFKVEYIIPHFLLQWIRNQKFDGIRYFSVETLGTLRDLGTYTNFVFPAQELSPSGLCRTLRNKFKVTESVSWTFGNAIKYTFRNTNSLPGGTLFLNSEVSAMYQFTQFGKIETMLNDMTARDLP